MKKPWIIIILIIIIAIITTVFIVKKSLENKYEKNLSPLSPESTEEYSIIIPDGATAKTISKILKDKGIIRDDKFFVKYIKEKEMGSKLRAGEFILSPSMHLSEILNRLTEAPDITKIEKFVIPEGFERKNIAKRIEEKGIGTFDEFMNYTSKAHDFKEEFSFLETLPEDATLEGYLFPATYDIKEGETIESLVHQMLKAYESRYKANIEQSIGDRSLNEIMTLSSIVEKEARTDEDRPLIASVCYNRLKIEMPLQMDSTVQFAMNERKEAVLYKDLEIDSPYNTYKNKGLPPGPIANPGLPSIEAALNPPETDYLFFVLTGEDGSHTFTKTYEEHRKAKEKMIRP